MNPDTRPLPAVSAQVAVLNVRHQRLLARVADLALRMEQVAPLLTIDEMSVCDELHDMVREARA